MSARKARESAREEFEREKERRLWQQQQPQSRPTGVHVNVALPRMANDNDMLTFLIRLKDCFKCIMLTKLNGP